MRSIIACVRRALRRRVFIGALSSPLLPLAQIDPLNKAAAEGLEEACKRLGHIGSDSE